MFNAPSADQLTDLLERTSIYNDKGTVTGSVSINLADGQWQRFQVSSSASINLTGWESSNTGDHVLLEISDGGGVTISWPTINWYLSDGTTSTSIGDLNAALQAAATNYVVLWSRDGGTTIFGVLK